MAVQAQKRRHDAIAIRFRIPFSLAQTQRPWVPHNASVDKQSGRTGGLRGRIDEWRRVPVTSTPSAETGVDAKTRLVPRAPPVPTLMVNRGRCDLAAREDGEAYLCVCRCCCGTLANADSRGASGADRKQVVSRGWVDSGLCSEPRWDGVLQRRLGDGQP
jgi:hypothetical protein